MEKETANNKKGLLGKLFWVMVFAAGIKYSRGVPVNWFLIFSVEKEIVTKIILKLKKIYCIFSKAIISEWVKSQRHFRIIV